jgi:osmoprotectant transport system permease protein
VELPLALPEIIAGLRIATTTTVGLAALAFYAGAGGLGQQILTDIRFKSNVATAAVLCIVLAFMLDLLLLGAERLAVPWRRVRA